MATIPRQALMDTDHCERNHGQELMGKDCRARIRGQDSLTKINRVIHSQGFLNQDQWERIQWQEFPWKIDG